MRKLFFTGAFLVTILTTVTPNKNASKELQNSNVTDATDEMSYENVTSIKISTKKKNITYVDHDLQKVWAQYLAEVQWFKFTQHTEKRTTEMVKERAVTKTIKAFRESSNVTGKAAASNTKFTLTPEALSYGIRKNRTTDSSIMRRRGTMRFTEGTHPYEDEIHEQQQGQQHKLRFEGFRQPYWKGGDHVFLRTGSPTAKAEAAQSNPMQIYRGCDRTCNYYFKTYGAVCGHRYNMKKYTNDYKNFDNICDIEQENCQHKARSWHPLYRGTCFELKPFSKMEYDYMDIVWRGKNYIPYVYTPRPPTKPTPDPVDLEIEELQKEQQNRPRP